MADIFSRNERSRIMSLIKSKNTRPEIALCKLVSAALHHKGYRYRKNYNKIPGKPDLVFVNKKIAIFIDGDFWHGYNFVKLNKKLPKKYWLSKIKNNIVRDKKVNSELKKLGWKVLRFWEHDLNTKPEKIQRKIVKILGVLE